MPAAAPTLDDRRTKATFDLFKELKYLRDGGGDGELTIDDVGRLDVEKMKAHILDCLAAVCEAQRVRVAQKQPMKLREDGEALTPEQQEARNKVFGAALKEMTNHFKHDGCCVSKMYDSMIGDLLRAFPDKSKLVDGRGWLPMHWAIVAENDRDLNVDEDDAISIYETDPMVLRQHHLVAVTDEEASAWMFGYTPAHMLCKVASVSLVRHFSALDPRAFTMKVVDAAAAEHSFSALHLACYNCNNYGDCYAEELLRLLVQLNPSQMKSFTTHGGPLGLLCQFSPFLHDDAFRCLVDADSSVEVVYDAITSCFASSRVRWVAKLLEANPAAAKHRGENGSNLAHQACMYSGHMAADKCIEILKLLLAQHKDALKETDDKGQLPAHYAAINGPMQVLDFILNNFPEAAAAVDDQSRNLLHCIAEGGPEEHQAAKVRLLCTRYPAMMLQRNMCGNTPLLVSCVDGDVATALLLCEIGGREAASAAVLHPTDAQHTWNGQLPLHWLIDENHATLTTEPLSETADAFRLLLRLYPEAAGTEGGIGAEKITPYQLAIDEGLPTYYRRLLLRAAPHLDPAELHRLNWAERRQAMFVAFAAVFKTPSLLVRLRAAENKDLLKHVVSFL